MVISWEEILENFLHLGWSQIPSKWQSSQTTAFLANMRSPNFTERGLIFWQLATSIFLNSKDCWNGYSISFIISKLTNGPPIKLKSSDVGSGSSIA